MARKKKIIEGNIENSQEKLESKPIGDVVKSDLLIYGDYVTNNRHTVGIDGCKLSYRRLIWAAYANFPNKMAPSMTVISSVAKYHGHSLDGIFGLNSILANTGIFDFEGSAGFYQIDGTYNIYAHPRYTHQKISDTYYEIFKELIPEIPQVESEVGDKEVVYLPLPIPLALYLKTSVTGLLIGFRNDYCNFSPWSMYQAMIHDKPQLLEPNANLLIDKEKSELDKLWYQGSGRIVYSYKLTRTTDSYENPGILFEGDTFLFTPNFKKLNKLAEEGKVYMEDLTDKNGPKMMVSRVPGARGISIEDIEDLCRKCCYSNKTYNLNVTDGKTTYRIPLREWLKQTYNNFIELTKKHNLHKQEKVSFDIAVLENLPIVSNYIINENPKAKDEELSKVLGIHPDIISAIMSKPISYIRNNKDNSTRLKNLKAELKELKKFDPVKYTEEIIKKL